MFSTVDKSIRVRLIPYVEEITQGIVRVSGRLDVNYTGSIMRVNWLKTRGASSPIHFSPRRYSFRYGIFYPDCSWYSDILSVNDDS